MVMIVVPDKEEYMAIEDGAKKSRRKVLKIAAAGVVAGMAAPFLVRQSAAQSINLKGRKILIVYFSRTGNTREVANQIRQQVGGDLFEVRTVQPYPAAYRATTDQAKREQQENARPALTAEVNYMAGYDVVFIGYPNWWGTLPMAYFTFLEHYDFAGKTIVPFCTHEGSHMGRSESDLRRLCPRSILATGIALRSADGHRDITEWLHKLGA